MLNEYFETNQSLWDEKVDFHAGSAFYDLEGFKNGKNSLNSIELEGLGAVTGKSLLHLQCHFGQDTLSWARLGAKATGVDLSPKSIALANSLNAELGLDARFIQSNVYDLPARLDEQFDIVFTSYGTICWLPDLKAWASLISRYLKPGGIFFMAEFHPALYMFDWNSRKVTFPYFESDAPIEETLEGTYAQPDAPISHKEYTWTHSLHQVIAPLLGENLTLIDFQEFDWSPYNCFPDMRPDGPGRWVWGGFEVSFPHVFSLKMGKPG